MDILNLIREYKISETTKSFLAYLSIAIKSNEVFFKFNWRMNITLKGLFFQTKNLIILFVMAS